MRLVRIIFHTAAMAVRHAGAGAAYGAPAAAMVFVAAYVALGRQEAGWLLLFVSVGFLLANTAFAVSLLRRMMFPHLAQTFGAAMKWDTQKTELLFSLSLVYFLLPITAALFATAAVSLVDFSLVGGDAAIDRYAEAVAAGRNTYFPLLGVYITIFGSRTLAAGGLALALLLWLSFMRHTIRVPAQISGHYLNFSEAWMLTRGQSLTLLAANAVVNLGVAAAITSLNNETAAALSLEHHEEWGRPMVLAGGYWLICQFNFALWVALFEECTAGYKMRKDG